jgi:hypothetical protein
MSFLSFFFFFFCQIALGGTSNAEYSARVDILPYSWCSGKFSDFHHRVCKCGEYWGLSYGAFTKLKYFPSIPTLLSVFILKACWILSVFFLHLLKWSCNFYPSASVT